MDTDFNVFYYKKRELEIAKFVGAGAARRQALILWRIFAYFFSTEKSKSPKAKDSQCNFIRFFTHNFFRNITDKKK